MTIQSHTEQIWIKFHDRLLAYILKRIKDKAIAEDILQEVFIRIQLNLENLKEDTKIQSWIFSIARNAVNDHFRKLKPELNQNDMMAEPGLEEPQNVMHVVEGWLGDFIQELPEKYRDAIVYSELEGMPQKEMAEKLGISYSNVRARVQRGRRLLKNSLEMCCEFYTDQYGNVLDYQSRPKKCSNC